MHGAAPHRDYRFVESVRMAASQLTDDSPAEDVLNLQNAARNAIFNVEIPTHPPIRPALERICEVSRLMADGATSSIIVRNGSGWEVGAACGAGAEKITGMPVDPHGKSVTGFVISARKPYYFANIASLRASVEARKTGETVPWKRAVQGVRAEAKNYHLHQFSRIMLRHNSGDWATARASSALYAS